ncbi:MAG: NYN domain-containing protein [Peptococcaceae bacterium]|nr:NYN domain-containing protein [Peptococcaceae bacterium]
MRVIVLIDYENIWGGLSTRGYELTPEKLADFLREYAHKKGIEFAAVYVYANFDREEFWRTQTAFEKTEVFTRHVFSKNSYTQTDYRRNAADLELMLEAQELLLTRNSVFDAFFIMTGDGDFLPLIRRIRAWGKQVRVIGIQGSMHKSLQNYWEADETLEEMLQLGSPENYDPQEDLPAAVRILAELQLKMPYIASTKARTALKTRLNRSLPQVKQFIRRALADGWLLKLEHSDASLRIGRTKIYIIHPEHPQVRQYLSEDVLKALSHSYRQLNVV